MVYKIRVILDAKKEVFRDIEIREKQTLWNLHQGIKSAFSLPGEELSSFYYSDDEWTEGEMIPLEDMSDDGDGDTMSDIYVKEGFAEVGAKMLFKYGLIDLWEFFCELKGIMPERNGVVYPFTAYRFGNVPLKVPAKGRKPMIDLEEDESLEEGSDSLDEDFDDDKFDELDADMYSEEDDI